MNSFFLEPIDTAGISITHPDTIPRVRTIVPPSFFVGRLSAEFSDFKLGWSPIYPTRLVARPTAHPNRLGGVYTSAALWPAFAPLGWAPYYPRYRAAPRLHRVFYPSTFDPQSGHAMIVAQSLAWDPRQKAPLITRPKIARTQFAYTPPPETAAGSLSCTALADRDLTSPTILTQAVTQPAMLTEDVTVPVILTEGVC